MDRLDAAPASRRFLSGGRLLAVVSVSVAALVALVGVVVAADGGDADPVASIDGDAVDDVDSPGSGGGSAANADFEDALLDFAECMRENGVDMPDPESRNGGGVVIAREDNGGRSLGPGPGDEDFEAAQEACGDILEDARDDIPRPSPEEMAEMQDRLVAMAECMRARGHDMPDPEVSGDGGVSIQVGSGGGIPVADSDEFAQDQQECSKEAGMGDGPGIRIGDAGEGE